MNSKNQLESHKLEKHKTNEIFSCEYCKEDLKYKKGFKEPIKLHKTEENEQRSSKCKISESQNETIQEQRQKDIKSHNETEELLRQCRKDMLDDDDDDEDDEVYIDSDSEEW